MIPLLDLLSHHGEAADPYLLEKIKHQLDVIFGVGPWPLLVLFGLTIVLIPISIIGFYRFQRRRMEVCIKEHE